jgi:lipase chaperone LimK
MKKKWVMAGPAALALLLLVFIVVRMTGGRNEKPEGSEIPTAQGQAAGPDAVDNPEGAYVSAHGPLPAMLRGKKVEGSLGAGRDGRLIVLPPVKRRFEHFLAAADEEGLSKCADRVRENIRHSLPSGAAEDALKLFDSYLDYRKELPTVYTSSKNLPQSTDQVLKLKDATEKRNALRRKHLTGAVADALFGEEDIFDDFNLKRMALFYDTSLDPDEKKEALRKLESLLPGKIRERKKQEREIQRMAEED